MSASTTGSSETTPSTASPVRSDLGLEHLSCRGEVGCPRVVLRRDRELGVVQSQRLGGQIEGLDTRQGTGLEIRRSRRAQQREAPALRTEVDGRRSSTAGCADLGVVLEQHEVMPRGRPRRASSARWAKEAGEGGVTDRRGILDDVDSTWPKRRRSTIEAGA